MYIKAKYPKVGQEWYRQGVQGFGSLYGGNQISDVENNATSNTLSRISTSEMFGGNIVSIYVNINNGNELVFTNESVFIVNNSTLNITEVSTERALEFINESNWVYKDPIADLINNFLDRVDADGGTLDNEIGLDTVNLASILTMIPSAYKDSILYSVIPSDGTADFDVVRNSVATRINSLGNIQEMSNNVPRIDYRTGTPTLLVEPQRTNLIAWSETLGNNTKSGAISFAYNSVMSPDGDLNGSIVSVSSSNHRLQPSFAAVGGDVTMSIFLKHDGTDFTTQLNTFNTGTSNLFGAICFVTSTGVTFTSYQGGFSDVGFTNYGNGWFRIFVVCQSTSGTTFAQWRPSTVTTAISYPCFGFQVEAGDTASSYIPTSGAIATRLEDDISVDLTSLSISSITETIDGVEQTPITVIPLTYTIPQGNINKIVMI